METDSSVVYHGTNESRFSQEPVKRTQIQLTQEELRILRDCNRESFYYRCLPFALAGMAAAFLAVKNGYLKGSPRFGPAGKMSGAVVMGWLLGKLSYRKECEDKFLRLENSTIGDVVRKKRGLTIESYRNEGGFSDENLSLEDNKYANSSGDDFHSSTGSLNLDMDKNVSYSGLDDRERPTTDRENYNTENETLRPTVTYEELRRRNRDTYERPSAQRNQTSSNMSLGKQWPEKETSSTFDESSDSRYSKGSKNIYGDTLEWKGH